MPEWGATAREVQRMGNDWSEVGEKMISPSRLKKKHSVSTAGASTRDTSNMFKSCDDNDHLGKEKDYSV
jgi:hypothetical protein